MEGGELKFGVDTTNIMPSVKTRVKKPKRPDAPMYPRKEISFFREDFVKEYVEKNPPHGQPHYCTEFSKAGAAEWDTMTVEEKAPYVKKAEEGWKAYEEQLEPYKVVKEEYLKNMRAYYNMKQAAGEPLSDMDDTDDEEDNEEAAAAAAKEE